MAAAAPVVDPRIIPFGRFPRPILESPVHTKLFMEQLQASWVTQFPGTRLVLLPEAGLDVPTDAAYYRDSRLLQIENYDAARAARFRDMLDAFFKFEQFGRAFVPVTRLHDQHLDLRERENELFFTDKDTVVKTIVSNITRQFPMVYFDPSELKWYRSAWFSMFHMRDSYSVTDLINKADDIIFNSTNTRFVSLWNRVNIAENRGKNGVGWENYKWYVSPDELYLNLIGATRERERIPKAGNVFFEFTEIFLAPSLKFPVDVHKKAKFNVCAAKGDGDLIIVIKDPNVWGGPPMLSLVYHWDRFLCLTPGPFAVLSYDGFDEKIIKNFIAADKKGRSNKGRYNMRQVLWGEEQGNNARLVYSYPFWVTRQPLAIHILNAFNPKKNEEFSVFFMGVYDWYGRVRHPSEEMRLCEAARQLAFKMLIPVCVIDLWERYKDIFNDNDPSIPTLFQGKTHAEFTNSIRSALLGLDYKGQAWFRSRFPTLFVNISRTKTENILVKISCVDYVKDKPRIAEFLEIMDAFVRNQTWLDLGGNDTKFLNHIVNPSPSTGWDGKSNNLLWDGQDGRPAVCDKDSPQYLRIYTNKLKRDKVKKVRLVGDTSDFCIFISTLDPNEKDHVTSALEQQLAVLHRNLEASMNGQKLKPLVLAPGSWWSKTTATGIILDEDPTIALETANRLHRAPTPAPVPPRPSGAPAPVPPRPSGAPAPVPPGPSGGIVPNPPDSPNI